jgi:hypothetical protein
MDWKKTKKNRGFVILFAVTLASIILAVALGVADIALNEVKFSTSAKDTGDAFYAADTATEYVLYNDKPTINAYPTPSAGTTQTWPIIISNLGSAGLNCAIVTITKDNTNAPNVRTSIVADGFNIGDASCASSNPNRVEREIDTNY